MTPVQLKALIHVLGLLKSFDTYPVYSDLIGSLKENPDIQPETIKKVMGAHQTSMNRQAKPIAEATSWVETLIEDAKTN